MKIIILLTALLSVVYSEEVQKVTLKDGRILIGMYDESSGEMKIMTPFKAAITIKKSDIIEIGKYTLTDKDKPREISNEEKEKRKQNTLDALAEKSDREKEETRESLGRLITIKDNAISQLSIEEDRIVKMHNIDVEEFNNTESVIASLQRDIDWDKNINGTNPRATVTRRDSLIKENTTRNSRIQKYRQQLDELRKKANKLTSERNQLEQKLSALPE